MAGGVRWTRPHGHPAQSEGDVQVETSTSAAPTIPVSSEEVDRAAAVKELRGEELDQALEDAELPKTGSADEKRARLAEHLGSAGRG